MGATVYLDDPVDGAERIDCEEVQIISDVAWATPVDSDRETVVPLSNVTGIESDDVEQRIRELESPGGRFTELVTDLS